MITITITATTSTARTRTTGAAASWRARDRPAKCLVGRQDPLAVDELVPAVDAVAVLLDEVPLVAVAVVTAVARVVVALLDDHRQALGLRRGVVAGGREGQEDEHEECALHGFSGGTRGPPGAAGPGPIGGSARKLEPATSGS